MIQHIQKMIVATDSGLSAYSANLIAIAIVCLATMGFSLMLYVLVRHYITKIAKNRAKANNSRWLNLLVQHSFFSKLSYLIPLSVAYSLLHMLDNQDVPLADLVFIIAEKILSSLIILNCNIIIITLLNVACDFYQGIEPSTKDKPVKSYVQVLKIIVWIITILLFVSNLGGMSPLSMLTGLGAMSAVLMVVFKDSISGFISSVHVSAYDIVRIGDWITIKSDNIDGVIIEISLSIVKIRGFDKSIITIPTQCLVEKGVINWREMQRSGGRRMNRYVHIDMSHIKFCSGNALHKLSEAKLFSEDFRDKIKAIESTNDPHACTNLSLYREYAYSYLRNRGDIHNSGDFPLIVRELQPEIGGIPIEIYAFTTTTDWAQYEHIQAEIIEHLTAALPIFDLKICSKV